MIDLPWIRFNYSTSERKRERKRRKRRKRGGVRARVRTVVTNLGEERVAFTDATDVSACGALNVALFTLRLHADRVQAKLECALVAAPDDGHVKLHNIGYIRGRVRCRAYVEGVLDGRMRPFRGILGRHRKTM